MTTDEAIQALVRQGAALTMRLEPTPIPVTWWRRVNAGRHFYFTTGDTTFDGHRIDFAREQVVNDGLGVAFYDRQGNLVAYLTTFAEQNDDPEWVKNSQLVLDAWRARFDNDQALRAFVLAEYSAAG